MRLGQLLVAFALLSVPRLAIADTGFSTAL